MMFKMTHAMISTVPTTAGRCQTGWLWFTVLGVSD